MNEDRQEKTDFYALYFLLTILSTKMKYEKLKKINKYRIDFHE